MTRYSVYHRKGSFHVRNQKTGSEESQNLTDLVKRIISEKKKKEGDTFEVDSEMDSRYFKKFIKKLGSYQ
jgi:hypothetical protein